VRPLRRDPDRPGWWTSACGRILFVRRREGGYSVSPAAARWWGILSEVCDPAQLERQTFPRLTDAVRAVQPILDLTDERPESSPPACTRQPTSTERRIYNLGRGALVSDFSAGGVFAYQRENASWIVTRHYPGTVGGRAGEKVTHGTFRTLTAARRAAARFDASPQLAAYQISQARDRAVRS